MTGRCRRGPSRYVWPGVLDQAGPRLPGLCGPALADDLRAVRAWPGPLPGREWHWAFARPGSAAAACSGGCWI